MATPKDIFLIFKYDKYGDDGNILVGYAGNIYDAIQICTQHNENIGAYRSVDDGHFYWKEVQPIEPIRYIPLQYVYRFAFPLPSNVSEDKSVKCYTRYYAKGNEHGLSETTVQLCHDGYAVEVSLEDDDRIEAERIARSALRRYIFNIKRN